MENQPTQSRPTIIKQKNPFKGIVIILSVIVLGLIGFSIYLFVSLNNLHKDYEASDQVISETHNDNNVDSVATLICAYGFAAPSEDCFTVALPDGWIVENRFEPDNIVKTVDGDEFLMSSFIEDKWNDNIMSQRVAEGIKTIKTVRTKLGTNLYVLQTPTTLFLASCVPTGENCYLSLNDKKLYIHLYQVFPYAQSAMPIDFSSDSAKEIIKDFGTIAASLSI